MTDRELLEAAAIAAGLKIDKSPSNGGGHGNTGFDVMGNAVLDWHNGTKWNPLTDDGDALRLAVKLGIAIELHPAWVYARAVMPNDHYRWHEITEGWGITKDPLAATRRAVVRAAAALAKQGA
jgi:hypothetical protein